MPSMGKFELQVGNETGEKYHRNFPRSVGSDGIFKIRVPDEPFFDYLVERSDDLKRLGVTLAEIGGRVKQEGLLSKNLEVLENVLKKFAKDFIACEVRKEQVILYSFQAKTCYYKTVDGELYVNGYESPKGVEGDWNGSIHSLEEIEYYKVGFCAHAAEKTSFVRPGNTTVEYEYHPSSLESEYGKRLNSFNHLNPVCESKCTEIPYSDKAADFFFEVLMSMCKLSDKFETFFSEDEAVIKAIENSSNGLFLIESEKQ